MNEMRAQKQVFETSTFTTSPRPCSGKLARVTNIKSQATYNSRTNSLVNALEGQNAIAQVLVLSILVKERPSDRQELFAGIFTKDVIQEIYSCQILIKSPRTR